MSAATYATAHSQGSQSTRQRHSCKCIRLANMAYSRACETCGRRIIFKRNSKGKPVPFDLLGPGVIGPCHYETCTQPPGSSLYGNKDNWQPPVNKESACKRTAYYMSSNADRQQLREIAHNKTLTKWTR